jgi:hypothetical protein
MVRCSKRRLVPGAKVPTGGAERTGVGVKRKEVRSKKIRSKKVGRIRRMGLSKGFDMREL